jgi:hypothetical protein
MEKCIWKLTSRFKQIDQGHIRDLPVDSRRLQVEAMDFRRTAAAMFIRKKQQT